MEKKIEKLLNLFHGISSIYLGTYYDGENVFATDSTRLLMVDDSEQAHELKGCMYAPYYNRKAWNATFSKEVAEVSPDFFMAMKRVTATEVTKKYTSFGGLKALLEEIEEEARHLGSKKLCGGRRNYLDCSFVEICGVAFSYNTAKLINKVVALTDTWTDAGCGISCSYAGTYNLLRLEGNLKVGKTDRHFVACFMSAYKEEFFTGTTKTLKP